MDFTKRTIFKIFAKKRAASKGRFFTFRRNNTRLISPDWLAALLHTMAFFCFYNQLIYSGLQTCYRTQDGRVSE